MGVNAIDTYLCESRYNCSGTAKLCGFLGLKDAKEILGEHCANLKKNNNNHITKYSLSNEPAEFRNALGLLS